MPRDHHKRRRSRRRRRSRFRRPAPYYHYNHGIFSPYYGGGLPLYGGGLPLYGGGLPLYGGGGGFSTSDSCLEDGQGREVLFLENNCAGFPTGPICCPGQRDIVYCQGNVGNNMSVGALYCTSKDDNYT